MQVFFHASIKIEDDLCRALLEAVIAKLSGEHREKYNSGFTVKNSYQFFISDILCYESLLNMFVQECKSRDEEYFRDNNELMLPWIL